MSETRSAPAGNRPRSTARARIGLGAVLAATWGLFFLATAWALALFGVSLLVVGVAARRALPWFVMASPPCVVPLASALLGGVSYFVGTATLLSMGMPGPEFDNLDPAFRVYRESTGCVVMGHEPFWQVPNNLVVEGLVKAFGPMRGAYAGPYPSGDEARAAIDASSLEVSEVSLERGVRLAADVDVRLSPELLRRVVVRTTGDLVARSASYRAATVGPVLLLGCDVAGLPGGAEREGRIVLVVPDRGELIATYRWPIRGAATERGAAPSSDAARGAEGSAGPGTGGAEGRAAPDDERPIPAPEGGDGAADAAVAAQGPSTSDAEVAKGR